jgi:hypothetical protein
MTKSVIQDEQEMVGLIESGMKFEDIIALYLKKYGIVLKVPTISSFRNRRGMTSRQSRNPDLIPWGVLEVHKNAYLLEMLRLEAQVRDGKELTGRAQKRHADFLANLEADDVVVAYTEKDGFQRVPRRKSDTDIIRKPARQTRKLP